MHGNESSKAEEEANEDYVLAAAMTTAMIEAFEGLGSGAVHKHLHRSQQYQPVQSPKPRRNTLKAHGGRLTGQRGGCTDRGPRATVHIAHRMCIGELR